MIIELVNLLFGLSLLLAGTTAFIYATAYAAKFATEWGHRHRGRAVSREADRVLLRENLYLNGGTDTLES